MPRDGRPKFDSVNLGPLPHDLVSDALGVPVARGVVRFTAAAQKHAHHRHPETFGICRPHLAQAIAAPTYIGQSPHHRRGFEMILSVPTDGLAVLVAVTLKPVRGAYLVKSVYPIDEGKLTARLARGHLVKIGGD